MKYKFTCPVFLNLEAMRPLAALSKSALSNTTKGAFPPNSICTFLTCCAHWDRSILPTAVEPVNDIFLINWCSHSNFPIADVFCLEVVTTFKHPFGRPANSAIFHHHVFMNQFIIIQFFFKWGNMLYLTKGQRRVRRIFCWFDNYRAAGG